MDKNPSAREGIRKLLEENPDLAQPYINGQKAKIAKEYLKNQRIRQTAEDFNEALRRGWITLSKGDRNDY